MVPEQGVFAKPFNNIGLPTDFTIGFDCRECSAFEVDIDSVTVTDWRCIASRTVSVFAFDLRAKGGRPLDLAIPVNCQQGIISIFWSSQVDGFVYHDWC